MRPQLCTNYDDSIGYHAIKGLFDQCNADKNDFIDLQEFYAWVCLCFGECDDSVSSNRLTIY